MEVNDLPHTAAALPPLERIPGSYASRLDHHDLCTNVFMPFLPPWERQVKPNSKQNKYGGVRICKQAAMLYK
jgi:hypothetical protein